MNTPRKLPPGTYRTTSNVRRFDKRNARTVAKYSPFTKELPAGTVVHVYGSNPDRIEVYANGNSGTLSQTGEYGSEVVAVCESVPVNESSASAIVWSDYIASPRESRLFGEFQADAVLQSLLDLGMITPDQIRTARRAAEAAKAAREAAEEAAEEAADE
jgi:hypothetical protein